MSVRFPLTFLAAAALLAGLSSQALAQSPASTNNPHDTEVSLEFRLLSVSECLPERLGLDCNIIKTTGADGLERIGVDFEHAANKTSGGNDLAQKLPGLFSGTRKMIRLNDAQVSQLMEALQGDQRCHVIQAPKLTVADGQISTISTQEQQLLVTGVQVVGLCGQISFVPEAEPVATGVRLEVQPVVSADRRTVKVKLKGSWTELACLPAVSAVTRQGKPVQPKIDTLMAVDRTLRIPDGGTVVLGGWKREHEGRNEFGPPVLSKIPYINRLFKNVGYGRETEQVLLMVTPHVLVNKEEEPVTCPYLKQQATKTTPDAVPAPPTTVLDNLAKLQEARKKLQQAEHHRKKGETELARQDYEKVKQLCPGSNLSHLAANRLNHLHAQAMPKAMAGAAEEQEAPAAPAAKVKKKTAPSPEKKVSKLMEKYQQACTEGRLADARKLAGKALTIDPACFSKQHDAKTSKRMPELQDDSPRSEEIDCEWPRIPLKNFPAHLMRDRIDGGF